MLTIFPSLLSYEQLAPTLVRLTLAVILIHWAYKGIRNNKILTAPRCVATVEGVAGVLLLLGVWTQIGALIVVVDMIVKLVQKVGKKEVLSDGVNYYLIVFVLALTLLVTGAGFLAYDLPM